MNEPIVTIAAARGAASRGTADPLVNAAERDARLFRAAQELESNFLAEMLKSAGFGKPRDNFGGGRGEEQFSSFLVEAQADAMVQRGGIGLAEHLFNALKGRADDTA